MINVKDAAYGAVGDGVTDDRAAIQTALDDGGWVYVPPGVYALASGLLHIKAHTRLTLAPGATMLRTGPSGMITNADPVQPYGGYSGHGNIVIEGGVWDVNGVNIPAYASGIGIAHSQDVTIRDTTIRNVPGWHAIEVNSSRTVLVDNCRFEGFRHDGDRNFSEAVQIDAAIDQSTGYAPYDGTVCDGIEIRSCRVGGGGADGTQPWPRGVGTHSVPQTWHRNIRITGCVFDSPSWSAVRSYWWDRAIIAGNQVVGADGEGIAVQYDSRYVLVHGNQIVDSARNGILISNDCTQIDVRDNTVIGSGRGADNTYGGIRVGDSSYVRVVGNTVRKRASGNAARYGLWIDSACSGVQRYGNDLRYSGATGSLSDSSSSPVTSAGDAT